MNSRPPTTGMDAYITGPYRYWLTRDVRGSGEHVGAGRSAIKPKDLVFIGLNPSTADQYQDDPTIRRCINFARQFKRCRLIVLNLFAFRATNPGVMMRATDPIGPENDATIRRFCTPNADRNLLIIVGWGSKGRHLNRDREVLDLIHRAHGKVYCLRLNKDGAPAHPLYLPRDSKPIPY